MPGKTATDQLLTIRQILGITYEYNIDTQHLFINFLQAYDTPTIDEFLRAMNQFDIPSKLIKLNQMTLGNTLSCVKAAGGISNSFKAVRSFR